MEFGWAKVSEGPGKGISSGYVSERWTAEKPEMQARAEASGFVPGGYLFLAEGNGPAQADYFAKAAGDMDGWAIAVDVEPREATGSHPTMVDAVSCVRRLRYLYPGHPIGGYIPQWYWGARSTTFVDYLWASHYVQSDPGPPGLIYRHVPASWWASYGGRAVSLLQFTDKAVISGVDGPCDCSAFRGTAAELRKLVLPKPKAAAGVREDDPVHGLLNRGKDSVTPLALPRAGGRLVFLADGGATVRVRWVDTPGDAVEIGLTKTRSGVKIPDKCLGAWVRRLDEGTGDVSYLVD
jgi:hypothetical protein